MTGSSQNTQIKTSSTSDFQRDSTPIFSARRKDKMTFRLVGALSDKNGEFTVIAQQKAGAGMRYGGMLLSTETQDTVTLHSNTFLASELTQKI